MLTLFWIVGITNAFNLLDNMDGLCAGIAADRRRLPADRPGRRRRGASPPAHLPGGAARRHAPAFSSTTSTRRRSSWATRGSLFLGLNLAALTLRRQAEATGRTGLLSVVAAPVLPLLIPIFDTTLVTAMRLLSGRRPSQGGRDHTSHRLVAIGLSEPRAVTTLWAARRRRRPHLAAAAAAATRLGLLAALMFVLAMIIFAVYLARIRVYDDGDLRPLRRRQRHAARRQFHVQAARRGSAARSLPDSARVLQRPIGCASKAALFATNYPLFIQSLPIVLASQLLALFVVGGYRGTWRLLRHDGRRRLRERRRARHARSELAILYLYRFENYSRAVFVIYAALLMLLLSGTPRIVPADRRVRAAPPRQRTRAA